MMVYRSPLRTKSSAVGGEVDGAVVASGHDMLAGVEAVPVDIEPGGSVEVPGRRGASR